MYDVIIVGGGIAGMSAALILGRCRRSVMLFDTDKPRNRASSALHGFLTRDGIHPLELRRIAREQLEPYRTVAFREAEVIDAAEMEDGYEVRLADGSLFRASYLLLATGIVDRLPEIEGIAEFYGRNVFHCPYCDGWEMRNQPLAAYASGDTGSKFALELTTWSDDILLCTDGGPSPSPAEMERLDCHRIGVNTQRISQITGTPDRKIQLHFANGSHLRRTALFFYPSQYQASPLALKLGCSVTSNGVEAGKFQQVKPRLFVAGDAARSIQLAIIAAAEGAEAAFALNTVLHKECTSRRG